MLANRLLCVVALVSFTGCTHPPLHLDARATAGPALESLTENQRAFGFRAAALYVDGTGTPMGARFIHERSGFTFDYLRLETATQALFWVSTLPPSDKGESHTQEHLLITKGNKGRALNTLEQMMLARSNAMTGQWRTYYGFHTDAAPAAFWPVYAATLDALLHPDYSDEEVRREVRNFGVAGASDGPLRLEEKGAVYNEMVRTVEQPAAVAWDAIRRLALGATHPLARNQGGTPEGIRALSADEIRRFHQAHYHLGNMGMIGVFPRALPLETVLQRMQTVLDREPARADLPVTRERDVPPAAPAPEGTIALVDFPYGERDHPGRVMLAWPGTRRLDTTDRILLEAFLDAFASDGGSALYKKLIDRQSRVLDVGASAVWSWLDPDPGRPVFVGIDDVAAARLTNGGVAALRDVVTAELDAIAALPDGSPALAAFEGRVASRLSEKRRQLAKLLDTPPRFGFRDDSDEWLVMLAESDRERGFRKSLAHEARFAELGALLTAPHNPWRERLRAWGLVGVRPYGVAARPSPSLRDTLDREHAQRLTEEVARLRRQHGVADDQAALRRYRDDYDRHSAELERAEAGQPLPPFTDAPPMTLDDLLEQHVTSVRGVPMVAARFDTMKGATVSLALRLDSVPDELLVFVPLLPRLISDVGVAGSEPLAHDEVRDRLRNEVLRVSARLATNASTGRAELILEGAGSDVAETRRALGWLARLLTTPDWRARNLPRIRDVIEEALAEYRNVMLGPEEQWVNGPANFFWRQDRPLLAHAASFLTMAHDAQRLRWLFDGATDAAQAHALARFSDSLAKAPATLDDDELHLLANALARGEAPHEAALLPFVKAAEALPAAEVRRMGQDLAQLWSDSPPSARARDWAELCGQMAADGRVTPAGALSALQRAARALGHQRNARLVLVGSSRVEEALAPDLDALVGALDATPTPPPTHATRPLVLDRLRERDAAAAQARFFGLVNPQTQSGVFLLSTKMADFAEARPAALLDFLAANLYAGGGAHSLWARTAASGLAYSNGMSPDAGWGRLRYYAERCSDLATTMRFVVGVIRDAQPDPRLADYAFAMGFRSRVADTYEERAFRQAADLSDGITPELVRAFRTRLIGLRAQPDFATQLFARVKPVYAPVLPGLAPLTLPTPETVAFVIGPEKQLAAWERYLQQLWGAKASVARLYPRDFWAPATPLD